MPPVEIPLQIGDRVRIVCEEIPQLCVERTVGPDGTVDLPLLGPLQAVIDAPEKLARSIADRLPLNEKPANIEVRRIGGPVGEIEVLGAVSRPLRIFSPLGIDRDRLLIAAKATPEADLSLLGPNRRVRPGETLRIASITAERKISVLGGVVTPRSLPPANGLSLASALEAAGGLGAHADRDKILVERYSENIPLALPRDAGFTILPGDTIRVGLIENRHYVVVKGLVRKPGSVAYGPGMTALAAIEAAGGILDRAKKGTLVWQTGAKTFRLSLAYLLDRRIPDPAISPEDTILVEAGAP